MKILSLRKTFSADHSESDYQYVTWEPREDVDDKSFLNVGDEDTQVTFEKVDERAALLVGALLLKNLKEMRGTLIKRKVLDRVIKKLSQDFSEFSLELIEEESQEIMSWLESGEVVTDPSYYEDFWFEKPRYPEHTYATKDTIRLIEEAIKRGFDLIIEYYSRGSGEFNTRKITPKSFDGEMLEAYCHLRKDDRVFKVSRIKSIKRAN